MRTEKEIQRYREVLDRRADRDNEDFRAIETARDVLDWVLGDIRARPV